MVLVPDPTPRSWTLPAAQDADHELLRARTRSPASPTAATRATSPEGRAVPEGTGIADTAYFGPEAEFFIFDDVRFDTRPDASFFYVDSVEAQWNTGKDEGPNLGYKPRTSRATSPSRRWTTSPTCAAR
jgi:glutamine synthetase